MECLVLLSVRRDVAAMLHNLSNAILAEARP
jgi:hypothetical protein